jgi:hypothetical protein
MNRILALALLLASPANAATYCISVQLSTASTPTTSCQTFTDASLQSLVTTYSARFFPGSNPTTQQVLDAIRADLAQKTMAEINSYLQGQAAAKAAAAVAPVQ